MKNNKTLINVVIVCCLIAAVGGCKSSSDSSAKQDFYFIDAPKLYSAGSACLLELYNECSYPGVQVDVTDALYHAIMKQQVFTLSMVKQDSPAWKNLNYQPGTEFTLEQLYLLQKNMNSRTIITGSVVDFKPYPHLLLTIRIKAIDLRDGKTIWAVEQVWDSADRNLDQRVKKYIQSQMRTDSSLDRNTLTFVSSRDFIRFVCYEIAETLKK